MIGLVIGDHHCFVLVDRKGTWGIGVDRNAKILAVASSIRLEADRPFRLDFVVLPNQIDVLLEGQSVCHWDGDLNSLSLGQGWRPPSDLNLFLATNNNAMFLIDKLLLEKLE